MLVFFVLGNAKVLSFALADAKVPNASSFAFWWNIGLTATESTFQQGKSDSVALLSNDLQPLRNLNISNNVKNNFGPK